MRRSIHPMIRMGVAALTLTVAGSFWYAAAAHADAATREPYVAFMWELVPGSTPQDPFAGGPQKYLASIPEETLLAPSALQDVNVPAVCGVTIQIDLYDATSSDIAGLLASGYLYGPNNPAEPLAANGEWAFVTTAKCVSSPTPTPTPTAPPAPVLNCGPNQVPGWENQYGQPTKCVNNCPYFGETADNCVPPTPTATPTPSAAPTAAPTPSAPAAVPPTTTGAGPDTSTPSIQPTAELAHTGSNILPMLIIGGLLLALGLVAVVVNLLWTPRYRRRP